MKLSLIVPCYNEEGNVEAFYNRCVKVLNDIDYQIVFINDGSNDSTKDRLFELYENNKNVVVVNFSRNFGKEAAIFAGLHHAKGELTSIIDADLQQDPTVVLEMISILDDNSEVDIVTAYQEIRHESSLKKFFKKIFYRIINKMSNVDFKADASDFRTFRRPVLNAILDLKEYFRFSKGIFAWIGFHTEYIPYDVNERFDGETKWSFIKLLKYAIEGIVSFSVTPLHIATFTGILISFLSMIYGVFVIFQKLLYNISIPGYATLVILILFLGGIQLLVLGILGEYLAKTYIQGKHRPVYVEKEVLNKGNEYE